METQHLYCSIQFPVRFSDLDAMGHLNNARYLTYFEEGRADWFHQVLQMPKESTAWPVIVARIEIDYLAPVPLGVEVRVHTRCVRLGTKSLDFEGEIRIADALDSPAARYKAVLVWYDYAGKSAVPIPAEARAAILASGQLGN